MFIWGVSWPSGKILSAYGGTTDIVFCRYVIVFFSLLPLLWFLRINLNIKKEGIPTLLLAGVFMALYGFFFLQGLKHGLSGAGGVLTTTLNPIIAYTLGLVVSRKLPNRNESIGLFIGAIAGCILLKVWNNLDLLLDTGNIYFLLGALMWSLMSKLTATAYKYGDSLAFSLWMYLVTAICLSFFVDFPATAHMLQKADQRFWINIIYNGVVSTAWATTAYFFATTKLGAEKASSFIFLVPASAALSAWLILDEQIQIHTIIGGAIGMVAVYVINTKRKISNG